MSPHRRPPAAMPKLIIPQVKSVDGYFTTAAAAASAATSVTSGGYSSGGGLTPCFLPAAGTAASSSSSLGSPQLPPALPHDCDVLAIGDYLLLEPVERSVYKAVNASTAEQVVCKVFPLTSYRSKLAAYFRLDGHCNVASIREIILAKSLAYVMFDQHYGDLHSYVKASRRLTEEEARALFSQIVAAVAHCHANGVIVRDLKLRKFVFADAHRKHLVLEGLEQSHVMEADGDDTLTGTQGCPGYICPEMLESSSSSAALLSAAAAISASPAAAISASQQRWPLACPSPAATAAAAAALTGGGGSSSFGYSGSSADVWSLGVMLYGMLTGRYPFQEPDAARQFEKIRSGSFTVPPSVSPAARCLVKNLLRHDAGLRPSVADVACHPWLTAAASSVDAQAAAVRPNSSVGQAASVSMGDRDQRVPDLDLGYFRTEVMDSSLPDHGDRAVTVLSVPAASLFAR